MRRWSEKVREEEAKAPGGGHGGEERDPALYVSVECRSGWGMGFLLRPVRLWLLVVRCLKK